MTTHIDTLVRRCLMFTDRNGKVLFKRSNPFDSALRMEFRDDDLYVAFSVQCSAFKPGSVHVKVKHEKRTVLEVAGSYVENAYKSETKKYVPGDWEQRVV